LHQKKNQRAAFNYRGDEPLLTSGGSTYAPAGWQPNRKGGVSITAIKFRNGSSVKKACRSRGVEGKMRNIEKKSGKGDRQGKTLVFRRVGLTNRLSPKWNCHPNKKQKKRTNAKWKKRNPSKKTLNNSGSEEIKKVWDGGYRSLWKII